LRRNADNAPVPHTEYVEFSNSEQWFYYYDLKELSGFLLYFLTDGNFDLKSRGSYAPFILFKNGEQHADFIKFLMQEEESVSKKEPDFWSKQAKKKMTRDKDSVVDVLFLSQVYQLYNEYIIWSI